MRLQFFKTHVSGETVICPRCRMTIDDPHRYRCPRCAELLPRASGCTGCGACGRGA